MHRLRPLALTATTLALALGAGLAPATATSSSAAADAPRAASVAARTTSVPATRFRVSTFNVLGNSHTAPGGDRKGWASGKQRMVWATSLITQSHLDLVGFQEMEAPQHDRFRSRMGSSWAIFPERSAGYPAIANSIAWKTSVWTAVSRGTYKSPYFHGRIEPRPLVQLRNNVTGQLVWVLNTHNAADTEGKAKKWRDAAEHIQAALVNRLQRQQPSVPVLLLGDMNDDRDFYCPMTYLTSLESASGGVHGDPPDGSCTTPVPSRIDWIMGTPQVAFSGYTAFRDALVRKTTDHPIVWSDASVAPQPARTAGVKRVVVVDIEGLPSRAVTAKYMPNLARMNLTGASTLHAQTTAESAATLPNMVSIVTGRRVTRSAGGHGVTGSRDPRTTVAHRAGGYVWSMFDVAHNIGYTTSLFSGDRRAALLTRSWDGKHGAADPYGRNNGRRKISTAVVSGSDSFAVGKARRQLAHKPTTLTFVQLGEPARVAKQRHPGGKAHLAALRKADSRLAGIMHTISHNPSTAGSTMVIVTSSGTSLTTASRYVVPFVVTGPGVVRGNLYALNPQYLDPGSRHASYSGRQPIRSGMAANLVATALRLPPVPRSTFDSGLDLSVFATPAARIGR